MIGRSIAGSNCPAMPSAWVQTHPRRFPALGHGWVPPLVVAWDMGYSSRRVGEGRMPSEGGAMWVLGAMTVLLLAAVTAAVAEQKGQRPGLWFLIALFVPVVALMLAVFALQPVVAADTTWPSAAEAARDDPVARALAAGPGRSVAALAEATHVERRTVVGRLQALRTLGLADHDATGRWHLTTEGVAALATGHASS